MADTAVMGRHRLNDYRKHRELKRSVIALIAAHNEADCIRETLNALVLQTRKPDEIYVFTDNCTDDTAEIAGQFWRFGVSVCCTVDNTDRKAGVLNRATSLLMPGMRESDVVMGFDADSVPERHFVQNALSHIDNGYGIVGATFHARSGGGVLGLLQRAEFARFAISQHKRTRCDVISGTGWASPVHALRAIAAERIDGQVWDTRHIVEDFELTLMALTLGFKAISPSNCGVTTDVMTTLKMWWSQRLRWQHGTLVALRNYGWTKVTRGMIIRQILTYMVMLATPLAVGYLGWSFALFGWRGIDPANAPIYASGIALVVIEQTWTTRRAGLKAVLMPLLIIPDFLYSCTRQLVYLHAIYKAARGTSTNWGAGTSI